MCSPGQSPAVSEARGPLRAGCGGGVEGCGGEGGGEVKNGGRGGAGWEGAALPAHATRETLRLPASQARVCPLCPSLGPWDPGTPDLK